MMMRLIGWAADFNDLDPLSPTWMGAKQYEIRAGESEALIWSLLWTLQANDTRPIHIASDALVVLHAATGKWGYQPEDDIALRLRATYQLVWHLRHNLGKDTLTNHIKGHSGQFGNELADTIAKSVRTGRMSPWKPCVNLAHWYHGSHPNILWAWLPFDIDHRPTSLPTYIDNAFCGTGLTPPSDDLEWLRIPHIAMNEANECWFQLRIASYNVSSIREAGRAAALREQAEFQGINVLGLQETRTELTDPCDSNYIRIIAGATSGVGGSELWLLRTQPFAWSQSAKYYFERHKAQVVHADSQLLLTTYHDGPLQLLFCVAHAPHSGQNHKVIENWWHQLATLIHRYLRHNHLILMIDANADPQLQSEGVGELQAIKRDKERPGDTCFGNFLAQFSLLLPATFAEWHEDRDVITWCSNDGRYQARNDFIAIPLTWRDFSLWSGPCAGLDSGTAGLDHTAVCIDVQGWCQLQKYTPMRPKFDRTAILHATDEDIEECFKDMPEVPWHTDVTTHAANIETFVEQRLAEHFPSAPTARKRSKVFSETTWYHMTMRNRFKKVLTCHHRAVRSLQIGICIEAWRRQTTLSTQHYKVIVYALKMSSTWKRHKQATDLLKQSIRTDRGNYIQQLVQDIGTLDRHRIMTELKPLKLGKRTANLGRKALPLILMKDGRPASSPGEARQRWREHFASMEGGTEISTQELLQRQPMCSQVEELSLMDIPSLCELEAAMRHSKPGTSMGMDQFPPELLRRFPSQTARLVWPLFFKQAVFCCESLQHKGGKLVAEFKRRGDARLCSNYRSLLVSSSLGKCFHTTYRRRLT